MTTKFKILSSVAFIALAIVLTLVGVWALTDLDFTVGGNITYTAPTTEAKDVEEYPTLQFYVLDATNRTVAVQANPNNKPTGDLVIPAKVLSNEVEYTVTSINSVSNGTLLTSAFGKLPELKAADPDVEGGGNGAFYSCQITSVVIPTTVTNIGASAFMTTQLSKLVIPDSVLSIENAAFQACYSLTSITIGKGVTSMESSVFGMCSNLAEVNILATTPPTAGYGMFSSCHSSLVINVPAVSVDAYKSAGNWSNYSGKIQAGNF